MIEIDGAYLEGGGQILRTSLSLSAILQEPFHIYNIRANRPKKGLMPQHLAGVEAAAQIVNAEVSNIKIFSTEFEFIPGKILNNNYYFDIGTAGSAVLLSQIVIPILLYSNGKSNVKIRGGTHVMKSPSYEYFEHCFLPNIGKMGARVASEMKMPGFYPKGGGAINMSILPSRLTPYNYEKRGSMKFIRADIISSNLPQHVNEREKKYIINSNKNIEVVCNNYKGLSAGNSISITVEYDRFNIGADELGRVGKPAEKVARDVLNRISYEMSHEGVDHNMLDQLLLYIALAGKGSIKYDNLSTHAKTNMYVISKFTGKSFEINEESKIIYY